MIGLLEKVLQALEVFESLYRLIEEKDISTQTVLLLGGVVLIFLLGYQWLRKFRNIVEEEKAETKKVADERDEYEEIIFAQKGTHRLSSKEHMELTNWQIVVRTIRGRRTRTGQKNDRNGNPPNSDLS